jgi:hypothetical protein
MWFRALVRQSIHDKFAQDEDDREEITNYPCSCRYRPGNIRWELQVEFESGEQRLEYRC